MDQAKIVSIVAKKHSLRVGTDDPAWIMGTIAEEVQRDGLAELQKALTDLLD